MCVFGVFVRQDNASVHCARTVTEWLDEQQFEWISDWPANSPDLNPIENVWGIMAQRLNNRDFKTEQEFRNAIVEEWDKISYHTIRNLFNSIPRRCKAVIDKNGEPTKY